jgi:glycosyltransferase involved in cell wall biosynthesis
MVSMNVARPHVALNAHLLSGAASYRSAGIHGYLFNTLADLPDAADGIGYTILVGRGQLPPRHDWRVVRSNWPTDNPAVRIMWEQVCAPLVLSRIRPDLLHGMAFALPLAWNGPAVVTIFDLSFLRYPDRLPQARRAYLAALTRISARKASRIIAISDSTREEVSRLLGIPADRIDVAYPGVNEGFARCSAEDVQAFRQHQGLPERFILYLGTLEPRKNLGMLVRAYARLPQRHAVRLVLAGARGWQADPILSLIEELGLSQNVILTGYIPSETLPLWYNAAEVFVYPSVYEGFGIPALEALACGVPVIASNVTSLPEVVGKAGVLLPPADEQAWADAIAALLDDPQRRRELGALGEQRARMFTWKETARRTAESYWRILSAVGEYHAHGAP